MNYSVNCILFKNIHEKNNNHYHNTTYNECRSTK